MRAKILFAFFGLKSEIKQDPFGFIFGIFFPLLIGVLVDQVWEAKVSAYYASMGYVVWDYFARLILEASRFHKYFKIVVDSGVSFSIAFYSIYFKLYLKFLISFTIIVTVFGSLVFEVFITNLLFSLALGFIIFVLVIIVCVFYGFLRGLITLYTRIGLWATPIFWMQDNIIYRLNPASYVLDYIRVDLYLIRSADLRYLLLFLSIVLAYCFICLMKLQIVKSWIQKDYLKNY